MGIKCTQKGVRVKYQREKKKKKRTIQLSLNGRKKN